MTTGNPYIQRGIETVQFEWDDEKNDINLQKHGIGFEEALAIFLDPELLVLDATRPEDGEPRSRALGMIEGRCFTVVLTMRGPAVRLISARLSSAKERKLLREHRPPPA